MDIQQFFGNDITFAATGDVTTSDGSGLTKEMVIRRLLTNPGTYIWEPNYGAGIGQYVGINLSTINFNEIKSTIISQILLEETVAKNPAPQISFTAFPNNILQCDILYYDSKTKNPITISFQISNSSNASS